MKELTDRQQEVLAFLRVYIDDHKYPPSVREVAGHFGITAKGGHDHLKALEKKGVIRCFQNRSRAIEVIAADDAAPAPALVEIPILGNVAAGVPLLAEGNLDGSVWLSQQMVGSGEHFGLRVTGDSMIDAGIRDGDLAVILSQETAQNGDIVVALVEEAVTLKYFFLEANRVRLQAANATFQPIFTQNVRLLGKLACLVRQY